LAKHRRKLSNYLLNKSLQLRYVAFVTVMSAIICGALGYLIWRQKADASEHLRQAYDDWAVELQISDPEELRDMVTNRTDSDDKETVLTLVGAGLGLVVVLFLYLVVMTHKVAGPLYKVSRYFDEMAAGKLGNVWSLRKGDMLQDFYDKFKEMHGAVRKRHQEDNEAYKKFLAACESAGIAEGGALAGEVGELRAHLERREKALV
jgi:hypothetical protein